MAELSEDEMSLIEARELARKYHDGFSDDVRNFSNNFSEGHRGAITRSAVTKVIGELSKVSKREVLANFPSGLSVTAKVLLADKGLEEAGMIAR